jgi:hypothetical protein
MVKEYLAVDQMLNSDNKKFEAKSNILLILLFSLSILCPFVSKGQKFEIGVAAGGGNYIGDLSPYYRLENYRPAGGIFARYNFSQVVSAKLFLNGVQARGADKYNNDSYSAVRNLHFIRTVVELGGQIEYNFFNYRDEKSRRKWTPYFLTGFGGMYMFDRNGRSSVSRIQPMIPLGVGFRYVLGGKWNLGLELAARKTFTDYFDHISGREINPKLRNANEFDRDWYFVTLLSLSYTFYTIPCPFDHYH